MITLLPRRANRCIANILLALVLFMQMLISVHACTPAQREAAFAFPPAHTAVASCHHQPAAGAASCVAHCSVSDQSLDTHETAIAAPPPIACLTVPTTPDRAALSVSAAKLRGPATGDPPIAIRFQVFRI